MPRRHRVKPLPARSRDCDVLRGLGSLHRQYVVRWIAAQSHDRLVPGVGSCRLRAARCERSILIQSRPSR